MFTIKLYSDGEYRQRILEADSFTILRDQNHNAEITLHRKNSDDDVRYDIASADTPVAVGEGRKIFQRAIIENSAGKTTEMITYGLPR